MSRFDLFHSQTAGRYLLDLQTDLLDIQSTRMIAPVLPQSSVPDAIKNLHPTIEVDGCDYVAATHLMGAVPQSILGKSVRNLSDHSDQFTRALDLLFQGY